MKKLREIFINISKLIKKYFLLVSKFLLGNIGIIYMLLPFIAMDLITRILGSNINFYQTYRFVPNFFTIIWAFLFVGISLCFKRKIGRWVYLSFNIIFMIFYLLNNVYYSMTNNFFNFSLLESTSEGSPYIIDAIKNCDIWVYLCFILIIGLTIFGFKSFPKNLNTDKYRWAKVVIIFIALHSVTPLFLGRANSDLVWSTWKNPRNVYNLFNDSNKSMRVSGLLEYSVRGIYITYFKGQDKNKDELEFLQEVYQEKTIAQPNSYTGIFEGKNVIFLQLEGIDNWLISKETTPTLYKMMNNSINFNNHYSFYTGGGSTFNSEFAVNAGFISPLSYTQNAYSFNKNFFPYSMPNMFKNEGYAINAFHMNYGEYYSRTINYKNWGFDNYYGLLDMYEYKNYEYRLDRELIENTEFSNLMFPEDTKFIDYIITYSSHLPFTNTKGVCKQLYDLDNAENEVVEFMEMTEEECVKRQVQETDYMVSLLLSKLKEKKILDETVIVVFTDHYLYTLEDESILEKYKTTSNNLVNKTPFFIWSNGMKKVNFNKVTSQLSILPTVLNLFGISYDPNNYIGTDALGKSYESLVFFSDYSWYDGNVYVEDGEVTNKKKISESELERKNELINYLARKNDLTLKYNYFKTKK
ncbi:MAG TPA: sulfatase-like hydrolase/transferase [Bacilli bacterium]|nr:sulfatase-like hydrolase/transferase [Bacilli bacterium]